MFSSQVGFIVYLLILVANLALALTRFKREDFTEPTRDIHAIKNINLDRSKNVETSFPSFWFHAEPNGFLWIGDFLMQWIQMRGNFARLLLNFDEIHGAHTTSYALNAGQISKLTPKVKEMGNTRVTTFGTRCEHPIFLLCWGFKRQTQHYTRITVNDSGRTRKPGAYMHYAQPVKGYYIPPKVSPVNACPKKKESGGICVIS